MCPELPSNWRPVRRRRPRLGRPSRRRGRPRRIRSDQSVGGPGLPSSDAQWAGIEPLLTDRAPKRGGRRRHHGGVRAVIPISAGQGGHRLRRDGRPLRQERTCPPRRTPPRRRLHLVSEAIRKKRPRRVRCRTRRAGRRRLARRSRNGSRPRRCRQARDGVGRLVGRGARGDGGGEGAVALVALSVSAGASRSPEPRRGRTPRGRSRQSRRGQEWPKPGPATRTPRRRRCRWRSPGRCSGGGCRRRRR